MIARLTTCNLSAFVVVPPKHNVFCESSVSLIQPDSHTQFCVTLCDVCNRCPKRFFTVRYLKRHQLVHSDYKQFCCGLCGKDYKGKDTVKRHFRKCSNKLRFSDV